MSRNCQVKEKEGDWLLFRLLRNGYAFLGEGKKRREGRGDGGEGRKKKGNSQYETGKF